MSHELETAAAGSVGGFLRWRRSKAHAAPVGMLCANCATPLMGPWCYACGQLGEDFLRSVGHLVMEAFEGLFHFDGRLWNTLPDLLLRPGKLTRAYLDGHRAPQIPPLRLFLVTLLVLVAAGSLSSAMGEGGPGRVISINAKDEHGKAHAVHDLKHLTPQERAELDTILGSAKVQVGSKPSPAASAWLSQRARAALEDPERFELVLESWSERFSLLMLPLTAAILSVLFAFNRRFFIFNHTIFSLHSLSFLSLLLALMVVLVRLVGGAGARSCSWPRPCTSSPTCAEPTEPVSSARWSGWPCSSSPA